jgi:UDP-N-acetylmuramoylalanine--D-glutamate ligase
MKITVVGAARSGLAAAYLAQRDGDHVFVTDAKPVEQAGAIITDLTERGIAHEFGGHTDTALACDLVIVSPGVPPTNPLRVEAAKRGIPVIGELEFASRHLRNPMVAITGTNGKTTTTALTTYVLNGGGVAAVSAGNIGTPLSAMVGTVPESTVIVVECSSYQLDTITSFRPRVSAIMNITPDHLSYHGTFQQYVQSKWKIFEHQREDDVVLLNADDEHVVSAHPHVRCTTALFSIREEVDGAFVRGGDVVFRSQQHIEEILMPSRKLGLPGLHNMYNSMASALAARAFEVRNENIRDSLSSFSGVEHRLENVRTIGDVRWVNDSKATNINAAWYALTSYDRPIVWIAGGRGDNNDYAALDDVVATNVKAIVCIGEDADAIFNHWCTSKRCVKALTLDEAVHIAADLAEDHDVVLFSPACKSFDMFANFEERGAQYKGSVHSL